MTMIISNPDYSHYIVIKN